MQTFVEFALENSIEGATCYISQDMYPDNSVSEGSIVFPNNSDLQATFDAYCKQFELAGEIRCDATTGHTYSPFWYSTAYYRVSNSRKVLSHTAIYKENWPVHLTKPLGIIESNTTTIPTAEYEQLKAATAQQAERIKDLEAQIEHQRAMLTSRSY